MSKPTKQDLQDLRDKVAEGGIKRDDWRDGMGDNDILRLMRNNLPDDLRQTVTAMSGAGVLYGRSIMLDAAKEIERLREELQAKLKVKPLVWMDLHGNGSLLQGRGTIMVISKRPDGGYHFNGRYYQTIGKAKDAAQEHHDALVLSMIEGATE